MKTGVGTKGGPWGSTETHVSPSRLTSPSFSRVLMLAVTPRAWATVSSVRTWASGLSFAKIVIVRVLLRVDGVSPILSNNGNAEVRKTSSLGGTAEVFVSGDEIVGSLYLAGDDSNRPKTCAGLLAFNQFFG